MPFALRGTFIHATAFGTVEVLQEIVCVVSGRRSGGKILAIVPAEKADVRMAELGLQIAIHQIPVRHSSIIKGIRSMKRYVVLQQGSGLQSRSLENLTNKGRCFAVCSIKALCRKEDSCARASLTPMCTLHRQGPSLPTHTRCFPPIVALAHHGMACHLVLGLESIAPRKQASMATIEL